MGDACCGQMPRPSAPPAAARHVAMESLEAYRHRMVELQIAARGVRDPAVLAAMREVPRERFVPAANRQSAYDDAPLGIGAGQTISQPYIVARMIEAARLHAGATVLEIGTGSGYAAAVMARIAARVITLERWPELAAHASEVLRELDCRNVEVHLADGMPGWPANAPYHAILCAAASARIPPAWLEQLAPGGTLVLPLGRSGYTQRLRRVSKARDGTITHEDLGGVAFVPLLPDLAAAPDFPPPWPARSPSGGANDEEETR